MKFKNRITTVVVILLSIWILIFLSFPLLFPSLKVAHYVHLKLHWNAEKYIELIEYRDECWDSCIVRTWWRGCGEWKQCYRKSEDKDVLKIYDKNNLWKVHKRWNLYSIVHMNAINNSVIKWYDYLPDWEYFYRAWTWLIDQSSLNDEWLKITEHIYWNWYFKPKFTHQ